MAWELQLSREFNNFLSNACQRPPTPIKPQREKSLCSRQEDLLQETDNEVFYLQVPLFESQLTLGLAIGCGFNFIKRKSVPKEIRIATNDCAEFEGENGRIVSLGSVIIDIFERPAKFHVISDDHGRLNPGLKDGFLGEAFFEYAKASICFETGKVLFNEVVIYNRQNFADGTEARVAVADQSTRRLASIVESMDFAGNNLSQRECILQLLSTFRERFYLPGEKLQVNSLVKYKINLTDETPLTVPVWSWRRKRNYQTMIEELEKEVNTMLKQGVVVPSKSVWNSPFQLKPKDSEGEKKWRFIFSCRELNDRMEKDNYKMPTVEDILSKLGGAQYYTVIDLASSSHQIELYPEDREKTAFTTEFGKFEYTRFPIGLKNGSEILQRMMDQVTEGLVSTYVYRDDAVVCSKTLEDHKVHVNALFQRLEAANLTVQTSKCKFFKKSVKYLGQIVSSSGFCPNPDKVAAILNFPRPRDLEQVEEFLASLHPLRRFVQGLDDVAEPLIKLVISEERRFVWGCDQQRSFDTIRDAVKVTPTLIHPNYKQTFYLTVGASDVAIKATLSQGERDKNRPIAYFSRSLTERERKYSKLEKEVYAIVQVMQRFKVYISGRKFVLIANQEAFDSLLGKKDDSGIEDLCSEVRSFGFKVDQQDDTTFSLKRC